jgi:hypothetical protein
MPKNTIIKDIYTNRGILRLKTRDELRAWIFNGYGLAISTKYIIDIHNYLNIKYAIEYQDILSLMRISRGKGVIV